MPRLLADWRRLRVDGRAAGQVRDVAAVDFGGCDEGRFERARGQEQDEARQDDHRLFFAAQGPQALVLAGLQGRVKHKNGKYLGLGLVILFCLLVLVTAFRASERYYSRNIVLTDTSYFLMSVGILLQGRDEFGWRHVLSSPTPLHSSEYSVGDSDVYELHDLVAGLLKAVLPVRPSAAVILNGLWFIAMAVSLYLLLFERTGGWAIAALVAVSYLVANPYLPTVRFGLTSLDPNLHAFMIGTSAFCWLLLAHSFRKRGD